MKFPNQMVKRHITPNAKRLTTPDGPDTILEILESEIKLPFHVEGKNQKTQTKIS